MDADGSGRTRLSRKRQDKLFPARPTFNTALIAVPRFPPATKLQLSLKRFFVQRRKLGLKGAAFSLGNSTKMISKNSSNSHSSDGDWSGNKKEVKTMGAL